MPPTRYLPHLSLIVHAPAAGDPTVTDRGFNWLDIYTPERLCGTFSVNAQGVPTLQCIPGIGLCCRAFVIPQDTAKASYTFSAAYAGLTQSSGVATADWLESAPATGGLNRATQLVQLNNSADVAWTADSTFNLPENPSVAFFVEFPDTPPDHDDEVYPPYAQITFGRENGTAQWGLRWDANGAYLLRDDGSGTLARAMDLPGSGYGSGAQQVIFRVQRGRICLSVDGGLTYAVYGNGEPDRNPLTVVSSGFQVAGQGGGIVFQLRQVRYYNGTYTSQAKNTETIRVSATPTFTETATEPSGTGVGFTDLSDSPAKVAQYVAGLTYGTTSGTPFTFYISPDAQSVLFSYPVTEVPGTPDSDTPFDARLFHAEWDEPYTLSESSLTCRVHLLPGTEIDLTEYRWRKVELWDGWRMSDDSLELEQVFTGYIRRLRTTWPEFGKCILEITAENTSIRFRRAKWSPQDVRSLGGMTVNEAIAYVFSTEGLNASYYSLHSSGDRVTLDPGTAEEPFELLRPGESKWETLERIVGYVPGNGLEIWVARDGTFLTGPKRALGALYANATPAREYRVSSTAELEKLLLSLSEAIDFGDSGTAVSVSGKTEDGRDLLGYAVDLVAETSTVYGTYCPWRELEVEELRDTCSVAMARARAQAVAGELFPFKSDASAEAYGLPELLRRDLVEIYGAEEAGVPDGTEYVVLSLNNVRTVDLETGATERTTTAGLRRR